MATVVAVCALAAFSNRSAAEEPKVRDLNALTCKEIMRLADDDRRVVIGFLHGYRAGQNADLNVDVQKLSEITDAFLDQCLDKPTSSAVEVFMAIPR